MHNDGADSGLVPLDQSTLTRGSLNTTRYEHDSNLVLYSTFVACTVLCTVL